MSKVTIKIKNFDKILNVLKSSPQIIKDEGEKAIKKTIVIIEAGSKPFTPVDTGRLRSAYESHFGGLSGALLVNTKYAVYVHEGTRPHFPPISAVEGWAKRHGVSAYRVALGIARKGTKAQPFLTKGVESQESQIQKIWQELGDAIVAKLAIQI